MNNLCIDVAYKSMNKDGEQLCGDHIDWLKTDDNSTVVVLADGMGSGVKASILSTLTSKIISTMIAEGISVEECVATIASTLPICSERQVAYSTFTIMRMEEDNDRLYIVQYDNPDVIMIRDGVNYEYEKTLREIDGKKVYFSNVSIQEDDVFIAMSDGALYAGTEQILNMNWDRQNIIDFMETFATVGFTAMGLTQILLDECLKLYGGKPSDDTTVCTVKVIKRADLNLIIGPPEDSQREKDMISTFLGGAGKHVSCGGTTCKIVASYLDTEVEPIMSNVSAKEIPPMSKIKGIDLATEGIITISRVLVYAKDYLGKNELYNEWITKKDGAAMLARLLFEESTHIKIFVGSAVNKAHQEADSDIKFTMKMRVIEELIKCLDKMGKKVKVKYY